MQDNTKFISRIAPTPSGLLHLGNALNFILTWALVKKNNGLLYLRIDDIDSSRSRPEYIDDIFQCLNWLGITYDKGPKNGDDFKQNYSQILKTQEFKLYLEKLKSTYNCQCSRSQIKKISSNALYPGTCRSLNLKYIEGKTATRIWPESHFQYSINGQNINLAERMGDFVIWRKDNLPSYQLVSTIEDHNMGITKVIRGEDLINSTVAQKYLSHQLQFPQDRITYHHHKLILDDQKQKLAKSEGAQSLKSIRQNGLSPRYVFQQLASFLQLPKESFQTINDFLKVDLSNFLQ